MSEANNRHSEAEITRRVEAIDLEPIIYKLVEPEDGEGWALEKADAVAVLYRRYLVLSYLYPERSIVPTKDIDKMWHAHILDTAKYRSDCDEVFGYFLDHFPYFGVRGEEDAKNLEAAFEATKSLFRTHFGTPEAVPSAACGSRCGGSLCENNACDSNSCKAKIEQVRPRVIRRAA